jgi:tetratricopeptide (TPR) repeat protein
VRSDYAESHHRWGVLRRTGALEAAAERFQDAVRHRPDAADYWLDLGSTLRDLGRLHEATHAFERAVQLAPDQVYAQNHLGIAYGGTGTRWRCSRGRCGCGPSSSRRTALPADEAALPHLS